MKKAFTSLHDVFSKFFPWILEFIKGTFYLLCVESFIDLGRIAKERWISADSIAKKLSVIVTSLLILSFLLYGVHGLWNDYYNWRTKEWRQKLIISQSQEEIEGFFKKYNQKFIARDCDFMAMVGADESMYDKWGHDKYENYKCEEFVNYQNKMIIPVSIEPIEATGDKLRARGRAIVITENQGEPWGVKAMYFDLWKVNTWDLWHFNNPKGGPRIIGVQVRMDN